MSIPAPAPPPEKYNQMPLVLGIVGQQLLGNLDEKQLRDGVKNYLHQLRQKFPDTPFLFLSPLAGEVEQMMAESAMQFVADEVAKNPSEAGAELIAVLPIPYALYKDFLPSSHLETFDRLRRENRYVELTGLPSSPLPPGPSTSSALDCLTAMFIARNCQTLIAAWDGELASAPMVVTLKRTGQVDTALAAIKALLGTLPAVLGPPDNPLEAPDTGPVCRLAPDWQLLPPETYDTSDPEEKKKYFERLDDINKIRLNRLNLDAKKLVPANATTWESFRTYLLSDSAAASRPGTEQFLRNVFTTADFLAVHYQQHVRRSVFYSLCLVFAAVVAFGIYAHLMGPKINFWFLGIYVLFLAIADLIYVFRIRGMDLQNIYQDYRTLAEGLRVQFYWCLAGEPHFASDYYLNKQKNELEWIRNVLKAQTVRALSRSGSTSKLPDSSPDIPGVLDAWVLGQLAFYRKSSLRDKAHLLRWRQRASGFLGASLLTSLVVAVVSIILKQYFIPLLLAFPVALVSLCHLHLKYWETRAEIEEDEEELKQADALQALIPALPKLAAKDRPEFRAITWKYLAHGFFGGLLLTLFLLLPWGAIKIYAPDGPEFEQLCKSHVHEWLIIAMVLTVALAALSQWYAEKMAFAGQHKQYKRMRSVFARAYTQLLPQSKSSVSEAQVMLLELGREALAEHADWLLLHRDRPMELPRLEI